MSVFLSEKTGIDIQAEIRSIRKAARKVMRSKKAVMEFLATIRVNEHFGQQPV